MRNHDDHDDDDDDAMMMTMTMMITIKCVPPLEIVDIFVLVCGLVF